MYIKFALQLFFLTIATACLNKQLSQLSINNKTTSNKYNFTKMSKCVVKEGNLTNLTKNTGQKFNYSKESVQRYKKTLLIKAKQIGLKKELYTDIINNAKIIDKVIHLDNKQPEKVNDFNTYITNVITKNRKLAGKKFLKENLDVLLDIESLFNVDKEVILSLWGMESNFGRNMGNFSAVDTLFTLSFEGRRRELFEQQFLELLQIIEKENHLNANLKSSWAGAMGQTQFMPSSFRKYAVDYQGDDKKDIWYDKKDVFASIAYYLASNDWEKDGVIATPVSIPEKFYYCLVGLDIEKSMKEWNELGITLLDKATYNPTDKFSLIIPNKTQNDKAFLVGNNYRILLDWNRSLFFATSVAIFSKEMNSSN